MHAERIRSGGRSARAAAFPATCQAGAVCVTCGQNRPAGATRARLICPGCGATVRAAIAPCDPGQQR